MQQSVLLFGVMGMATLGQFKQALSTVMNKIRIDMLFEQSFCPIT